MPPGNGAPAPTAGAKLDSVHPAEIGAFYEKEMPRLGAVGVANIMVISVLERRNEIGLRRALGATRGHIRIQFLSEAILLALLGGTVGVSAGVLTTAIYATTSRWAIVVPPLAWAGGLGAALLIGAAARHQPRHDR